jgi:hypothetical protein
MSEQEIRSNWKEALESVENGWDLSKAIGWGFNQQDLLILGTLHSCGIEKEKINDLLEDCNFHTDNDLLYRGDYAVYFKRVMDEY